MTQHHSDFQRGSSPWPSAEAAIDHQLAPSGLTVEMLRQNPDGLHAAPLEFEKYHNRGFATPSGKVEFFSARLEKAGHLPVPFMDGGTENPISFADTIGEGALIGISGERTNRFTHTQFHNIPSLMKGENEGTVDLHPEDARNRNIAAGQWLTISSPRGHIRMKARISDAVHPGVARIAWGWGEVDPEWWVSLSLPGTIQL